MSRTGKPCPGCGMTYDGKPFRNAGEVCDGCKEMLRYAAQQKKKHQDDEKRKIGEGMMLCRINRSTRKFSIPLSAASRECPERITTDDLKRTLRDLAFSLSEETGERGNDAPYLYPYNTSSYEYTTRLIRRENYDLLKGLYELIETAIKLSGEGGVRKGKSAIRLLAEGRLSSVDFESITEL